MKREVETGTVARCTFGPDTTAMALENTVDRGEAYTGAFELPHIVQALKGDEQLLAVLHVETRAVVADVTGQHAILGSHAELDAALRPLRAELPGVVQEVLERNFDKAGIGFSDDARFDTEFAVAAGVRGADIGRDLADQGA